MNGGEIALLIIGIIFGVIILFIVVDLIFVGLFKSKFIKHNKALEVMLHAKYDNLKKLIDIINKCNVSVPEKYVSLINSMDTNCFNNQETKECLECRNNLAYLRNDLLYLVSTNDILCKHNEVCRAKDAVIELDANYRTLIACYNADVIGYNYWIHFLPTRFIWSIAKVKDKEIV